MGLIGNADPIILQLYVEPLQKFRLAAQGHGAVVPPPERPRRGSRPISIRCRSGIRRSRARAIDTAAFPLHAVTQRPMPMYHSWGSQNAWLRQILGRNRLFMSRVDGSRAGTAGRRLGLGVEPCRAHSRRSSS